MVLSTRPIKPPGPITAEPLVIPVPQHQLTVKGGSSPKVQYIPIGSESGLNSNKITRAKLAAV